MQPQRLHASRSSRLRPPWWRLEWLGPVGRSPTAKVRRLSARLDLHAPVRPAWGIAIAAKPRHAVADACIPWWERPLRRWATVSSDYLGGGRPDGAPTVKSRVPEPPCTECC